MFSLYEIFGGAVLCGLVVLIYVAILSTLPGSLR
jgi:hypothetical protein